MKVITRFPPSPTGNLHIGGARTALFNYLYAKHHGGKIYLRLENTDEERSKEEYEQNIFDSLKWLGLAFDPVKSATADHGAGSIDGKPFWRQSERKDVYRTHLKKLVDSGRAYISKETPTTLQQPSSSTPLPPQYHSEAGYGAQRRLGVSPRAGEKGGEGKRRDEVVRFKNPNKKIAFDDLIRGHIEFDTTELGDMVIAKSLEEPLYHLAVVIDDYEMGITHVIRGEDHISNTPRQLLLQEALEFTRPLYAHIPLILAPDRSKLSKRHGAVSVTEYRDKGFLSEAFNNYLALLGWNPGPAYRDEHGAGRTEQEIFSLDELIKSFDLSKVQKGGAIFTEEKLRWMNREYLKRGGIQSFIPHIPKELLAGRGEREVNAVAEMFFERVSVFGDIQTELASGEVEYLLKEPEYPKELLKWKKATSEPAPHIREIISLLETIPDGQFTKAAIKDAVMAYAEANGKGNVLWPMRVALSGKEQSPDPFTLSAMLGKETVLRRLKQALTVLQ